MIGTGLGACPPRAASPTRDRGRPLSPSSASQQRASTLSVRSSSPRLALSPRAAASPPPPEYGMATQTSLQNTRSPQSLRSPMRPVSRASINVSTPTPIQLASAAAFQQLSTTAMAEKPVRRDGRICVHADTNNNVSLYPNYMYDPDGELIIEQRPTSFNMTGLVQSQLGALNRTGASCGLIVAFHPDLKDTSKQLRCGTFFQVSPSRAIAAFHTAFDSVPGRGPRARELWVSKSCSINHWASLFSTPKTRAKYFRKAKVVPGFEAERTRLLQFYGDALVEKCCGLAPRTAIDIVVIELPPDFRDDPYLLPLPKAKVRTVKKVAVLSYNQGEQRDENNRANVYHCTTGIPVYDSEQKYLHGGNKSLSPGLLVATNDVYICCELSLGEGSSGGPLVPLTLAHYFWGIQVCAFYDAEPVAGAARSRNYNVQVNFYHPAVLVLYEKFVLPSLPEGEAREVKQLCFYATNAT